MAELKPLQPKYQSVTNILEWIQPFDMDWHCSECTLTIYLGMLSDVIDTSVSDDVVFGSTEKLAVALSSVSIKIEDLKSSITPTSMLS